MGKMDIMDNMDIQILRQAARTQGTPAYVFDLDAFARRIRHMKKVLGQDIKILYAMKANPFFTRTAAQEADGLEVCSPGEYAICRRAGVPLEKIVLSGVNKEAAHVREVVGDAGISGPAGRSGADALSGPAGTPGPAAYTAESLSQLDLLESCAAKTQGNPLRVLLRLTSGNQFGMDEETILSIIKKRSSYPHLHFTGLQYYSGTQKKQAGKIRKELEHLDALLERIRNELQYEIRELEYGPGFHIPYFEGESPVDEDAMLADFREALDAMAFKGRISLEAGRFLAAPCGSYVTRVVDTKQNQGQNYCIVDGGINHVNYYGQAMAMKIPAIRFLPHPLSPGMPDVQPPGGDSQWTVCGSLCTSGDMLVKNLPLPGLKTGDMLVFDRIGAYAVTEGIYLFLSRRLPAVLTYEKDAGLKLVRGALPTSPFNDGSIQYFEDCIKKENP